MKMNEKIKVYGDIKYRGKCNTETAEQMAFFGIIRRVFPQYGCIAIHPKNEGKRQGAGFYALDRDKAMGLTTGASDIIIPAKISFVCELKRRDHTKSGWQEGQEDYLINAKTAGAFACVALGHDAAMEAFLEWIALLKK